MSILERFYSHRIHFLLLALFVSGGNAWCYYRHKHRLIDSPYFWLFLFDHIVCNFFFPCLWYYRILLFQTVWSLQNRCLQNYHGPDGLPHGKSLKNDIVDDISIFKHRYTLKPLTRDLSRKQHLPIMCITSWSTRPNDWQPPTRIECFFVFGFFPTGERHAPEALKKM